MNKAVRIIAVALLMVVAAGALYAGYSFITEPSGAGMGMSTVYLAHSPFANYLIPGIVLFVVNGLFNIIAAVATIKKIKNYSRFIIMQGILLSGWILAQVIMVRDAAIQHIFFFSTGVILITTGIVLYKEKSNLA